MRLLAVLSLTVAATIFTYLIGATLGSPVVQVLDEVATTSFPSLEVQNDEAGTTQFAQLADEAVTGESVTQRARQEESIDEEDDDDDDSTGVPVSSTTTVPPPRRNESTVLSEFNFVAQKVEPPPQAVAVFPDSPAVVSQNVVDEEDVDPQAPTEAPPAQEQQKSESEDSDSDNEITQDEAAGTTAKVPTFESEYQYTLENFNKEKVKNKNREELDNNNLARQDIDTTLSPANETFSDDVGNKQEEEWEYSSLSQQVFDGEGRAGCECGKLPFKIPVDEESRINPNPWLAAIVRGGLFAGGRPHCGGTLINNLYVLTSASCMDGLYATSVQVWLTAHDSFEHHQASFGNIKVNVQEIFMHPNYNRGSKENDLCLLKLSQAVDISSQSYFVPACLPSSPDFNFAGSIAKVTGWSDGKNSRICKGEMPVLDNGVCNRDTRHSGKITDDMVCAGFLTPTREETCKGDAGGPLISPNGGRATLIGITSWSFESRNKDYTPTVYSRVSEFSDWILHNTRDADWCGV